VRIDRSHSWMTGKPEVIRRRTLDRNGGFRRTRREVVPKSASRTSSLNLPEARFWITSELPTTGSYPAASTFPFQSKFPEFDTARAKSSFIDCPMRRL